MVSAGTDLLVLCVGWTLFFPFVLFSIPVILRDVQLSCSRTCRKKRWQSKQEDAAVNGEGEAESSLRRGSVGIALSLGLKQNNAQAFESKQQAPSASIALKRDANAMVLRLRAL